VYTNHPFSASLQVNWTFLKKYFKKYALPFNFFERKDNSFAVNFIRRKKEVQRKKQKKRNLQQQLGQNTWRKTTEESATLQHHKQQLGKEKRKKRRKTTYGPLSRTTAAAPKAN
jgi:hypothetical protein